MLECVEDGLHEAVGEGGKLIVPQFQPFQRVQVLKTFVWDGVDAAVPELVRNTICIRYVLTGYFEATNSLYVLQTLEMSQSPG